jgi:predicted nuclease of predicted toxin-antitoxin system
LRLLVDEDSQAKTLVRLLGEAGHDVLTVDAAGLNSMADHQVLRRAIQDGRALLTRNCGDFLALHADSPDHHGILAVYQDADPAKNMRYVDIVRALHNLASTGVSCSKRFVVLNAWMW